MSIQFVSFSLASLTMLFMQHNNKIQKNAKIISSIENFKPKDMSINDNIW